MARKITCKAKKKSVPLSASTAYALRAIYGNEYYLLKPQALAEAIRRIESKSLFTID